MGRTVVFAMPGFGALAGGARGAERGDFSVERFANGELHVELSADVAGADCVLTGSISPPESRLASYLLTADTLHKDGARSVTALLPYLAYARQDHDEPRRSAAAAWTGRLLQASGVDRVVCVDVHSRAVQDAYPVPLESLSPAAVLAAEVPSPGAGDVVVVSPDAGGERRAADVAAAAGIGRPVAVFEKRRSADGIEHTGMRGELAPHAVVVDDILDTGRTLISCCLELRGAGVERVSVLVTHGLFTGLLWQRLWDGLADRVCVTDTVPHPRGLPAGVELLSVRELLAERLSRPAAEPAPAL